MMAGIYITGIQMPVGEEMLCLNIHPDGKVTQHFDLRCDGIGRAIPVPDHGRLIDADAYESLLRSLGSRDYRREKGTICDAIKFLHEHYAPTVVPADREGEA